MTTRRSAPLVLFGGVGLDDRLRIGGQRIDPLTDSVKHRWCGNIGYFLAVAMFRVHKKTVNSLSAIAKDIDAYFSMDRIIRVLIAGEM